MTTIIIETRVKIKRKNPNKAVCIDWTTHSFNQGTEGDLCWHVGLSQQQDHAFFFFGSPRDIYRSIYINGKLHSLRKRLHSLRFEKNNLN